jgi:hypothetical protein
MNYLDLKRVAHNGQNMSDLQVFQNIVEGVVELVIGLVFLVKRNTILNILKESQKGADKVMGHSTNVEGFFFKIIGNLMILSLAFGFLFVSVMTLIKIYL